MIGAVAVELDELLGLKHKLLKQTTDIDRNTLNGWIAVDKPVGLPSAAVVACVKRAFPMRKIGHAGTLDPLASGILPMAIGEATKTVAWAMDSEKEYSFALDWGHETETGDSEGRAIRSSNFRPSRQQIEARLGYFVGEIRQRPHRYSAIKIAGKKSYQLASENIGTQLASRRVRVSSFGYRNKHDDPAADARADVALNDSIDGDFYVSCGKGTYVRSLAQELARSVGSCASVTRLRRHRVGCFDEAMSISYAEVAEIAAGGVLSPALIARIYPFDIVMSELPAIEVTKIQEEQLRSGKKLAIRSGVHGDGEREGFCCALESLERGLHRATIRGITFAIILIDESTVKPKRVFNS